MPDSSNHAPTPFRRIGRFVLVAGWMGVIYAFSDQPNLRVSDDDLLDLVLRKGAHLAVFGVLLVLAARAIRGPAAPRGTRVRSSIAFAWLVTLAYAIVDEWHQTFVPGRVGHPRDVAIDMIGATAAAALLLAWWGRPDASTTEELPA